MPRGIARIRNAAARRYRVDSTDFDFSDSVIQWTGVTTHNRAALQTAPETLSTTVKTAPLLLLLKPLPMPLPLPWRLPWRLPARMSPP